MAQSGKDAILAAARRIAQLDSDDDDDLDTDADWANWGGIDWKNLDVDHDAAELARDAVAESEAKTAEALGIPVRLARWLAKHKGGDVGPDGECDVHRHARTPLGWFMPSSGSRPGRHVRPLLA